VGWVVDDLAVEVVSDEPVLMVGIANAPYIGGGTMLAPGAEPDDGLLDVVVVTAVGPLARAAFAAALRRGDHLDRDDVALHRGRSVTLTGDEVPHDLDGEVVDDPPHRYRVAPAAWTLLG
jgi:diacylglycerol kinase family enzyme